MLLAQTLEKLRALGLDAMTDALGEQMATPAVAQLPFEDRIGMLVDREWDVARHVIDPGRVMELTHRTSRN